MEDFVDVIGLRMKDFQDMYEVTDNLGQSILCQYTRHQTPAIFLMENIIYDQSVSFSED